MTLSFGTASLIKVGGLSNQIEFLRVARSAGFSHFDTSPYYGFGMSESALGAAFPNDQSVSIASKVGIYPPGGVHAAPSHLETVTRKIAGKLVHKLRKPNVDYNLEVASMSISNSLRRLQRDYLDIVFLHDPLLSDLDIDALNHWMDIESTRVKQFGLTGNLNYLDKTTLGKFDKELILQTSFKNYQDLKRTKNYSVFAQIKFVYGVFRESNHKEEAAKFYEDRRNKTNGPTIIYSTSRYDRLAFDKNAPSFYQKLTF